MTTLAVQITGDDTLAPDFSTFTPSVVTPANTAAINSPFMGINPAGPLNPPAAAPPIVATPVATSPASSPAGSLPTFEKANVTKTEIKISGACTIESFGEITVGLDDRVRAVGEFRVAKVLHYISKEGDVVRQQILAPIGELLLSPWDSTDPNDDGIVRVRP